MGNKTSREAADGPSHRTWRRPSAEFLRQTVGLDQFSDDMLTQMPDQMLVVLHWQEQAQRWISRNSNTLERLLKVVREILVLEKVGVDAAIMRVKEGVPILINAGEIEQQNIGEQVHLLDTFAQRFHGITAINAVGRGEDLPPLPVPHSLPWLRRLYSLLTELQTLTSQAPTKTLPLRSMRGRQWLPERLTMLSDPETRLFMQAAWDMSNGDLSRLRRPARSVPYYEGEDGGHLYAAPGPITEYVDLDVKQQDTYTQKILALNDDMVVTYVTVMALWFADRGGERDSRGQPVIVKTRVHVNDVLGLTGVKRNKRDYRREQKMEKARDIWALSEIILHGPQTVYERGKQQTRMIHSRLLEVAQENQVDLWGEETPYMFLIAPGEYAIPRMREDGAMTAMLLKPILNINAHRATGKIMALRFGFYLSGQWRIRATHGNYNQPWTVESLLRGARIPPESDSRLRQRFVEQFNETFDSLCERAVIKGWNYLDWDVENRPHRNWWSTWLQSRVLILPPDSVIEHYASIFAGARRALASAKAASTRKGGRAKVGQALASDSPIAPHEV